MQLVFLHKSGLHRRASLVESALSSGTIAEITIGALESSCQFGNGEGCLIAVPEEWASKFSGEGKILRYSKGCISNGLFNGDGKKKAKWFVISNGRFATSVKSKWLLDIVDSCGSDIVTVKIEEGLGGYREKICLTEAGDVVGFRRYYHDSAFVESAPSDWPHHVFIKGAILAKICDGGSLNTDFGEFLSVCHEHNLDVSHIGAAGQVSDLETEGGLCDFVLHNLKGGNGLRRNGRRTEKDVKYFGQVLTGSNCQIDKDSILVGPVIVDDNAEVGAGAIITGSVIGPGVSIGRGEVIRGRVLFACDTTERINEDSKNCRRFVNGFQKFPRQRQERIFRRWNRFSYAGFLKRLFDIAGSLFILGLFLPVFPIIALLIKFSSKGSVFYKAGREGMYGKRFNCLKFRTMLPKAEQMQEQLRFVNQVDGPQFKMTNDPRVNSLGRFLRNTCIDEIPQFINVLLGQMSIVGPRPSPEDENSTCPWWREARLSVRPGITGLWQICRTREESKDFQEWIYYDTKYVRELSFKLDLWVCFKTAGYLIGTFLDQF